MNVYSFALQSHLAFHSKQEIGEGDARIVSIVSNKEVIPSKFLLVS